MVRQRLLWYCLVIILIIAFPVCISAQTLLWHADQLIEDNAGHDGSWPQVGISGSNVVAVWQQSDGSNLRIYSNYSTDGGATWHTDQLIEDNAGHNGGDPQVAISGSNVVAVWEQDDESTVRIYSNYSTDGGATWHADQLIEDNAGLSGYYPQVGISGSNVVAVWEQQDNGGDYRIYSNYSTDGGATWHADQLIEDNAGLSGVYPQVGISGSNVVAVWYQYDASNRRIYSNYSTDGGATWHADQLIEDNAGHIGNDPQVGISGSNVVAVWYQWDGSNWRIYSNYSTDGGATWHADQLIEDNAGYDGSYPQVGMSGSNVVAVWHQDDGSNTRIYSNYSTDGGATWHTDQLIEDNAGNDGSYPQVGISGSNVVAVWYQDDGSNFRIYSNYSTDGGATWHADQLIEDNAGHIGYYPEVGISGNNVVAVWYQHDGSAWRIYSNYATFVTNNGPDLTGNWHSLTCISKSRICIGLTKVENTGNMNAGRFVVSYYLSNNGTDLGALIGKNTILGLKAGRAYYNPFLYYSKTSLSGKYVIAVIDSGNQVIERDENNNRAVRLIP
jgi:hypothetical protein